MRLLKVAISRLVRLQARILLSVWDDPAARGSLGRVHQLMDRSEHENAVAEARSKYQLAADVRLGAGTRLGGDGSILIDNQTYCGERCQFIAHPKEAVIRIGSGCAISHNVHIRTEGYRTDIPLSLARAVVGSWSSVAIGCSVWIGANVFIRGGVTIGDDCIVGANSVVTSDLPANSICAGVPARVIRFKPNHDPR